MKYLCHVPIEQYGFISVEVEGTAEQAAEAYREVAEAMKPKPVNELPRKEFTEVLDHYLSNGSMPPEADEAWVRMSPLQQKIIKEIQLSKKRTN